MRLTPLKAVRQKCIDCSGHCLKDVKDCPFDGEQEAMCSLYPLRMGRGSRTVMKWIRAYCLKCCNGQKDEVKMCHAIECSLWQYRFGRRPAKAGPFPKILTTGWVLENLTENEGVTSC